MSDSDRKHFGAFCFFMKSILLLICLIASFSQSGAQYRYSRIVYTDPEKISYALNPYDYVSYRLSPEYLRVYLCIEHNSVRKIVIKDIDRVTFRVRRIDTIPDLIGTARIRDVVSSRDFDVIVSFNRITVYDRNKNTAWHRRYVSGDMHDFDHADQVNDSLLVLSTISNYHPLDGFSGLSIHIFNLKSLTIERTRLLRVPGVAMGFMASSWITTLKDRIFLLSPLSATLMEMDKNLSIVGSKSLPALNFDIAKNRSFESRLDSICYADWDTLYNRNLTTYPEKFNESGLTLTSFSKEFMMEVSTGVRQEYDHVEQVLHYSDSVFIISVARKGSRFAKRDLYFYNAVTNKVEREVLNFQSNRTDTMISNTDYFPVVLTDSRAALPTFTGRSIYQYTFSNPDLFKAGSKDTLDRIYLKDTRKNNYTWRLLEYSLD